MVEIWKDIPNTDSQYQVSNLGRVKSVYRRLSNGSKSFIERILIPQLNPTGYPQVKVNLNGKPIVKTVHRLVAEAFILNRDKKPFVNHIDGDKTNNIASNLEWVTAKENTNHAVANNLIKRPVTEFRVAQYDLDGNLIYTWSSAYEAEAALGIRRSCISQCSRGVDKSYKGYQWIRLKDGESPKPKIPQYSSNSGKSPENRIKVIQLHEDGTTTIWESITAAARGCGCSISTIHRVIRDNKCAYNSMWSRSSD